MEQCQEKCKCLSGVNQDVAYECAQPCESGYFFEASSCECYQDQPICPNGAVVTVTSYIEIRGGMGGVETTFVNVTGISPGGPARVIDSTLEIYSSGAWVEAGSLPYEVGDTYGGGTILAVYRSAVTAATCS